MHISKTIAVLAVALTCFSVVGHAQEEETLTGIGGITFSVKKTNVAVVSKISNILSEVMELNLGYYNLSYDAAITMTTGAASATVTGLGYDGQSNGLWTFLYSSDYDSQTETGTWATAGTLYNGSYTMGAYQTSQPVAAQSGNCSAPIWMNAIRISYDGKLTSTQSASTAGSAGMHVAAVPEPSSILAAMSMLAPAGLAFRRKRI